jgi:ribosome-binding ATPase
VLTSAVSELFLRRLAKQGYVRYAEGTDAVDTRADLVADGDPDGGGLKPMDDKLAARLEKLRDLVLFRFASTGVAEVLKRAAALLGLVPVFPVRSVQGLGVAGTTEKKVFRDCILVKRYVFQPFWASLISVEVGQRSVRPTGRLWETPRSGTWKR